MKSNQNIYLKALGELPELSAPDDAWSNIQQGLSRKDDHLQRAIGELKEVEAPEEVWNQIASNAGAYKYRKLITWSSVAASIAIIVMLVWKNELFLQQPMPDHEGTTFAVDLNDDLELEELELWDYIHEQCEMRKEVCEDHYFLKLNEELAELSAEKDELMVLLEQYPNDHHYKKYVSKIENHIMEVQNEMLQKLLQS